MQLSLNFETFQRALVESFPSRQKSIQRAFEDFELRIEGARHELGQHGNTTQNGLPISSVQHTKSVLSNKPEGKKQPSIVDWDLLDNRGGDFKSNKGVLNGQKKDKNIQFEAGFGDLAHFGPDQQQAGLSHSNNRLMDFQESERKGPSKNNGGEFKLPSITEVEQTKRVLDAKGSEDAVKGKLGNHQSNSKYLEGNSKRGDKKNLKAGNSNQIFAEGKSHSQAQEKSAGNENAVSMVLGLDFKDRVASLPKITELFENLEEIVCGDEAANESRQQTQINSRNENNQGERLPLPYAQEKINQWLEFVREYQRSKETNGVLGEYMKKLEQRYIRKDDEFEFRLNEQGIDTNVLDSFANNSIKDYDDLLAKGLGVHTLEKKGSQTADQNSSIIDDIHGDKFHQFKDSCWILLTSQKPTAISSNSKNQKDPNKEKTSLIQQTSAANKNSQYSLKNNDVGQQILNRAGEVGSDLPQNSLSGTQDSRSRAQHVRASTLEKEPGSNNFNYLQQLQQGAQVTMPQRRYGHSSCVINGKMYIFGGHHRSGSGQQAFHSLYECQVKLESQKEDLFKWKKIQVESPQTRDSHSCVTFQDQILIFGGSSKKSTFNDLYKYNVNQRMWTKLDAIYDEGNQPSPREGHVGIIVGGDKMFVHGGYDEKYSCFGDAFILVGLHKEIDQAQSEIKYDENGNVSNSLDLKSRRGKFEMLQWFKCEQEGDVPSGRDSHSAVVLNDQVYIFGGQDSNENLLNDFFVVRIVQTYHKKIIKQDDGKVIEFFDRKFKLNWREIKVGNPSPSTGISLSPQQRNWPQRRSSHSMTLFMNRFLVVIAGESPIETADRNQGKQGKESTDKGKHKDRGEAMNNSGVVEKKSAKGEESDEKESCNTQEDQKTRSMGDVWIYDVVQQYWQEIKPVVKVQQAFNNRKMRKTFDARMAHSANIFGNYIVIFGGYCIQSGSFSHPNFTVLSLLGCTDYMLPKVCTLQQLVNEHQLQLQIENKLEQERIQQKIKKAQKEQAEREKAEKEKAVKASKKKQSLQNSIKDSHGKNEGILPSISSINQHIPLDKKNASNGTVNLQNDSGTATQVTQEINLTRDSQLKLAASNHWEGSALGGQKDAYMQPNFTFPQSPILTQGEKNQAEVSEGLNNFGTSSVLSGKVSTIHLVKQPKVLKRPAVQNQETQNRNEPTHREVSIQVNQNFDKLMVDQRMLEDENRVKKKIQYQACPLDSTMKIANNIRNPLQLMVEVLKMQVDQYRAHFELEEQDSATRIVANQDEFDDMDISIDLLVEDDDNVHSKRINEAYLNGNDANQIKTKSTLQIKDTGPGFSHRQLKQMIQGEKFGKKVTIGGPRHIERLELFKYAALRLAEHTMIITRSLSVPDKQLLNQQQPGSKLGIDQPICEVHIGMLSQRFIKDSGASRLVAPIVTFRLQPKTKTDAEIANIDALEKQKNKKAAVNHFSVTKEFELVPLSPMSDKFLNLMLSYVKGIFNSVNHLKKHIIRTSFVEKSYQEQSNDNSFEDMNYNDGHRLKRAEFASGTEFYFCNMKDEFMSPEGQEDDIFLIKEKSLSKQENIQYMKIKEGLGHSLRLELSYAYIDFPKNVSVRINGLQPVIDNPFRSIIKIVQPEDNVAIRGAKQGMYRYWIVAQSVLTTLLQDDDNSSQITSRLEGLLIFFGNEFITKDVLSQPQGENIVRGLGKRLHSSSHNPSNEILHGIIMIDKSQSQNILTFDRQGVADRAFMTKLREDIWKSYRKWRKQNEPKMFGSNIDNLNDFMSVDEAHSVPHKYMKLENAEVELDCSIPIEKVRPSSTKKASTAHQKSIKNHDQSSNISMRHHHSLNHNKKSSKYHKNQGGGSKQQSKHHHNRNHSDELQNEAMAQQQHFQMEQANYNQLYMQQQMSMFQSMPSMAMMQTASHHQMVGPQAIDHNQELQRHAQQQSQTIISQQRIPGIMDSDTTNYQQQLMQQQMVVQQGVNQAQGRPFVAGMNPYMMPPSFHPYGAGDIGANMPGAGANGGRHGNGGQFQ